MPPERHDLVSLIEAPEEFLDSPDPVLRRMAVTALAPEQAASALDALVAMAEDPSPAIRAAVADKLGATGRLGLTTLIGLQDDPAETVREATATAYGEIGDRGAIDWLILASRSDDDRAVREAAVAALGAIGDPRVIDHLLDLVSTGPPPVRRRTIAALTVFDDDRIEPAIRRAAFDRNPGVREAAEMVVGRQIEPLEG